MNNNTENQLLDCEKPPIKPWVENKADKYREREKKENIDCEIPNFKQKLLLSAKTLLIFKIIKKISVKFKKIKKVQAKTRKKGHNKGVFGVLEVQSVPFIIFLLY